MINYNPGKRKIFERDCFVHNGSYFAARISVYEDGKIECWGLMDKPEFLAKAKSGWITVDIPDGTELRICNQDFVVTQGKTLNQDGSLMFTHKWISQNDFINEILDVVHRTNGYKGASEICFEAFESYLANPSDSTKEVLRKAYEEVPSHKRIFILGDQDLKDGPIRSVLGI